MLKQCVITAHEITPLRHRYDMVLGLKGHKSRSQGHKVHKHIGGDGVAGVSYARNLVVPLPGRDTDAF